MTRQWSVWWWATWLTISSLVLGSSPAWAQGQETPQRGIMVSCGGESKHMMMRQEQWDALSPAQKAQWCAVEREPEEPYTQPDLTQYAVEKLKKKRASQEFWGWGLVTIGAVAGFVPYGDHYTVFGDDVCVSKYSIEEGTCSRSHVEMMVGAALIGTGLIMVKVARRPIKIQPTIAPGHKSVTARIQW